MSLLSKQLVKCKFWVHDGKLKLKVTVGNECHTCHFNIADLGIIDGGGGGTDKFLQSVTQNNNAGTVRLTMNDGTFWTINMITLLPSFISNDPNNVLEIGAGGKLQVIADEVVTDAFGVPQFESFSI